MVGGISGFTYGRVIWSQFGLAYNWPLGAALGMVLFWSARRSSRWPESSCASGECDDRMATRGERIVIWLSGLLLAAVLLVLYAPVIIGRSSPW
jgi:ABC-type spermidine/putrescine transport system, permease component I